MYRSIISVFLCKPNLSLIFLRWLSTVWREIHSLSAISFSDEPLANNFTTLNSASLKYDVFTSLTGFLLMNMQTIISGLIQVLTPILTPGSAPIQSPNLGGDVPAEEKPKAEEAPNKK